VHGQFYLLSWRLKKVKKCRTAAVQMRHERESLIQLSD
jgi:hypothetical protein